MKLTAISILTTGSEPLKLWPVNRRKRQYTNQSYCKIVESTRK